MTRFRFEIQNCIDVYVDADTVEEARMEIINNLREHADEMIASCTVSNGVEIDE